MTETSFECFSCKFFVLDTAYGTTPEITFYGDCRRSAPKVDTAPSNYGGALWPIVSQKHFCGDGRKKPIKQEIQEMAS